jgi:hypothetical protein
MAACSQKPSWSSLGLCVEVIRLRLGGICLHKAAFSGTRIWSESCLSGPILELLHVADSARSPDTDWIQTGSVWHWTLLYIWRPSWAPSVKQTLRQLDSLLLPLGICSLCHLQKGGHSPWNLKHRYLEWIVHTANLNESIEINPKLPKLAHSNVPVKILNALCVMA